MSHAPLIKICGIRSVADAEVAAEAGADVVGLVMVKHSPRALDRAEAATILENLPNKLEPVTLFANASPQEIEGTSTRWIQIHGEETPDDVARIARRTGHRIIRGIPFDLDTCRSWANHPDVDMLLLDGPQGGHGQGFDHAHLVDLLPTFKLPVIIAGGLNPDSVATLVENIQPFGVDVSSGVEHARGIKDHGLIRAFCQAVHGAG
ncbi:MAG: phosphoribosylanthranilate isomerase [Phycisphaerales bacterium]|nr:phosphoribosylanthranilate isomerase [Phycisphaerales bacterium]